MEYIHKMDYYSEDKRMKCWRDDTDGLGNYVKWRIHSHCGLLSLWKVHSGQTHREQKHIRQLEESRGGWGMKTGCGKFPKIFCVMATSYVITVKNTSCRWNCVVCYLNLKDINTKYLKLRTQKTKQPYRALHSKLACIRSVSRQVTSFQSCKGLRFQNLCK